MKSNKYGIEATFTEDELVDPKIIEIMKAMAKAHHEAINRDARAVFGIETEEDKKRSYEQESYCHECGREYESK